MSNRRSILSTLRNPCGLILAVIGLLTGSSTVQAAITVTNPSFELPGTVKQTNWESVPGWSSDTVATDSGVETGQGPTDGLWTGFLGWSDPSVWNLTGHTIAAGETYTLRIDARKTGVDATSLQVMLYYDNAGSRTTVATLDAALSETMEEFVLQFTADDVPTSVGNNIGIEINNIAAGWVGFDNVRLAQGTALPGPYAWYRGDMGVTLDGSGHISNWATQTASGHDLNRVVGAPSTTTLSRTGGGTATVATFNGSSALWTASADFGSISGDRTVVARARLAGIGDGFLFDGSTGAGMTRAQVRGGMWQAGVQSSGFSNADPDTTNITANVWQTHIFEYDETGGNTEVTHWIDGALAGSHTISTDTTLGGLIVGENGAASLGLEVEMAELQIYGQLLSPAERSGVETALTDRWGDLVDLPFTYQNATVIQNSDTIPKTGTHGIAALELTSTGNAPGDAVTNLTFNLNGTTDPADIEEVQLYTSSGSTFALGDATLLATAPAVAGTFSANIPITSTTQYLWIAAKLLGTSEDGDILDAEITEFKIDGPSADTYVPTVTAPPEFLTVDANTFDRTLFTSGATYIETVTMVGGASSMTNYAGSVITLNGGATLTNLTHTYRIPAIIMATNGTLIATCDARRDHGADLNGAMDIDIAIRRSTDNGVTWSDMELICDLGEGHPASDPSLVLDQITGEIFCFYNYMDRSQTKEYRLWVQSSTDNGSTWSIPRDITDDITLPEWKYNFKFMTSGRGYQTRNGRLLHNIVRVGSGVHLFASDDHGQTWYLLNETPVSPADESKVIELADGRLMINSRVNGSYGARHIHLSSDGGQTWTGYKDTQLVDPGCNGAIIRYTYADDGYTSDRLLFSNANSSSGRVNLTLRISYDEGVTWSAGKVMDPGASAYSDLTICQDGSIGILYEPGYSEVRFISTTLEYLTDGVDSLSKPYQLPGVAFNPPQPLTELRRDAPASLIPFPRNLQWLPEHCDTSRAAIVRPAGTGDVLLYAEQILTNALTEAGAVINPTAGTETCTITLTNAPVIHPGSSDEAYKLETTGNSVTITAPTDAGLLYGVQTLEQLLIGPAGSPQVAGCSIIDWPAFGVRGFMHDVGRNFQSIDLLKTQIDAFARYKLNTFHWHLTEHAAWRLQSTLYPQLTDAANHWPTREPGQFYTKAEIADLVDYCAERNITVIPEIDIPGHSEAFRTAMGVTMSNPLAVEYLTNIVNEVCDLLPSNTVPRLHFGTDEVGGAAETPHPDLIPSMVDTARNRGREVMTWWHGLTPTDDAVINQLWAQYAPRANNPHIDSRANYVNHLDAFDGPIRTYFQQVCRTPRETAQALGGILCYWPDVNIDDAYHGLGISPVFPSMVAYSERVWRGAGSDYPEYWAKLPPAGDPLLEEFALFEEDMLVHRDNYFAGVLPFPYVRQTQVPWKLVGPFDHGGTLNQSFGPETSIDPSYEDGGNTLVWTDAVGGTIHLDHFFGFDSYSSASEGTYYALTYVVSETERDVDFWFQFGTPSVSRRRNGGNPPLGEWNAYGANVWINGTAVPPPVWNNPGLLSGSGDEIPFTNEGYFYREPTTVHLIAGTNSILLRVPQGAASGYGAGKWMFSCMPIDWDGTQARELDGITFHVDLPSIPPPVVEKATGDLTTCFEGHEIYDGSSYVNGWSEHNTSGATETLSGTDLNRTHVSGAESWIGGSTPSKDGGATTWSTGNSESWTLETRIRFNECSNGFALWLGIGGNRAIVEVYANRTQDYGGNSFNKAHNNEDGAYHVYRIAHDSGNAKYHVWRDGERLTPVNGATYDLVGADDRLIFGDYSGGSFGDGCNVDIDYVCYDQTGAYLPPGADADGDGLTDAWEYLYFGDIASAVSGHDDDGDGHTNGEEFIADTHPGNGNSRLRISSIAETSVNVFDITVPDTSPRRNYGLQAAGELSPSNMWSAVPGQGPVAGNGGNLVFTDTAIVSTSRFFRVEVSIP